MFCLIQKSLVALLNVLFDPKVFGRPAARNSHKSNGNVNCTNFAVIKPTRCRVKHLSFKFVTNDTHTSKHFLGSVLYKCGCTAYSADGRSTLWVAAAWPTAPMIAVSLRTYRQRLERESLASAARSTHNDPGCLYLRTTRHSLQKIGGIVRGGWGGRAYAFILS